MSNLAMSVLTLSDESRFNGADHKLRVAFAEDKGYSSHDDGAA